jgi:tetratricopeptide (TPR) repeat protein
LIPLTYILSRRHRFYFLLPLLLLFQCGSAVYKPPASAVGKKTSSLPAPKSTSDKGNSVYYFLVSELMGLEGHPADSLSYLNQSLKQDAGSTYLLTDKAYSLARQNKFDEAIEVAEVALKRNPNNVDLMILLGKLSMSKQKGDKVLYYFNKALAKDPQNEEAYNLLAHYYLESNNPKKAIEVLNKLLSINPESLGAYYYLGSIYAAYEKNLPKALSTYEQILQYSPDDPKVMVLIGEIYLAQKNFKKALDVFQNLSLQNPSDFGLKIRVGLLYYELKETDKAIAIFQEILAKNPKNERIAYYLGLLFQEKKDYAQAVPYFAKVTPHSDFFADAVTREAYLYKELGHLDRSAAVVKAALAKQSNVSDFYDLLSTIYLLQENYPNALSVLQKGLKLNPKNEQILFAMGAIYEKTGYWEKAIETMKQVLELNPNSSLALNFIGYTYAEHGQNLDEAISLISKASRIKPNDGFIVDSLGWAYFQKGDTEKALGYLTKANLLAPNETTITEHLGDVYSKKKDAAKARLFYQKSLSLLNQKTKRDKTEEQQLKRLQEKMNSL